MCKYHIFNIVTKADLTISAFDRLKKDKQLMKTLCLALEADSVERSSDNTESAWLNLELPKYKAFCGDIQGSDRTPLGDLRLSLWYVEGKEFECRLCGYRPPDKWPIWRKSRRGVQKWLFRSTRHCECCYNDALSATPLNDLTPIEVVTLST